jgi:hypothetical protein
MRLQGRQQEDEISIKGQQAVAAGEHSSRDPANADGVARKLVLAAEWGCPSHLMSCSDFTKISS